MSTAALGVDRARVLCHTCRDHPGGALIGTSRADVIDRPTVCRWIVVRPAPLEADDRLIACVIVCDRGRRDIGDVRREAPAAVGDGRRVLVPAKAVQDCQTNCRSVRRRSPGVTDDLPALVGQDAT